MIDVGSLVIHVDVSLYGVGIVTKIREDYERGELIYVHWSKYSCTCRYRRLDLELLDEYRKRCRDSMERWRAAIDSSCGAV